MVRKVCVVRGYAWFKRGPHGEGVCVVRRVHGEEGLRGEGVCVV